MDKLKKFLRENKVLLVLAIILILWLVAFVIIVVIFFYGSSKDVYGTRLDNLKDLPITEELKNDVTDTFKSEPLVNKIVINVKGANIFVNVTCDDGLKVDTAKKLAESTIALFSESLLGVYDIEFNINNVVNKEDKYLIVGTRNANSDGKIVWNEYNLNKESSAKS